MGVIDSRASEFQLAFLVFAHCRVLNPTYYTLPLKEKTYVRSRFAGPVLHGLISKCIQNTAQGTRYLRTQCSNRGTTGDGNHSTI